MHSIAISATPTPRNAIRAAVDALFSEHDAKQFSDRVRRLACRESYPDAAGLLQSIVIPLPPQSLAEQKLVSIFCDRSTNSQIRIFRVALALGVIRTQENSVPPCLSIEHLIAAAARQNGKAARIALAALGVVEDVIWDVHPLPANRRERAALALSLLIRAAFGERVAP
jgi:hypothetical protein